MTVGQSAQDLTVHEHVHAGCAYLRKAVFAMVQPKDRALKQCSKSLLL